jgi:hypothetical protein
MRFQLEVTSSGHVFRKVQYLLVSALRASTAEHRCVHQQGWLAEARRALSLEPCRLRVCFSVCDLNTCEQDIVRWRPNKRSVQLPTCHNSSTGECHGLSSLRVGHQLPAVDAVSVLSAGLPLKGCWSANVHHVKRCLLTQLTVTPTWHDNERQRS